MRGVGGGSRAGVGNTFGGDLAGLAPGRNEAGQSAEVKVGGPDDFLGPKCFRTGRTLTPEREKGEGSGAASTLPPLPGVVSSPKKGQGN